MKPTRWWAAAAFAATCLVAFATADAGQLTNPNFETGLGGWVLTGDPRTGFAQSVDSAFGVPPLQGHRSALLVTRDGYFGCGQFPALIDLWSTECSIPFTSEPIASTPPTTQVTYAGPYSVVMSQQVDLRAGDSISFDFQTFTNIFPIPDPVFVELRTAPFDAFNETVVCGILYDPYCNRIGFSYIPPGLAQFITPAPPVVIGAAIGTPFGFSTWSDIYRWQVTAPFAATWTLNIGLAAAASDSEGSTGLLLDRFRILPGQVDEPPALAMCAMALAMVVAARLRSRREAAAPRPS